MSETKTSERRSDKDDAREAVSEEKISYICPYCAATVTSAVTGKSKVAGRCGNMAVTPLQTPQWLGADSQTTKQMWNHEMGPEVEDAEEEYRTEQRHGTPKPHPQHHRSREVTQTA